MAITTATIQQALQALAARDADKATEANDEGFNQADTYIGAELAEIAEADMDTATRWAAYVMLRKYAKQLRNYGIEYDTIPAPLRPAVDDAGAREIARGVAYEKRVAKRRVENSPRIALVPNAFMVSFEYDANLVAAVKEIDAKFRRFDGANRRWVVQPGGAETLAIFAERTGAILEDGAAEALAEWAEWAIEEAKKPVRRMEVAGDQVMIFFPYDQRMVDRMRSVQGARFQGNDPTNKHWVAPVTSARRLIEIGEENGFTVDPLLAEGVEAIEARLAVKREASAALDAELEIPGLRPGMELYPFQKAGIRYLIDHADGRGMIGDEMGLGKTPQTMCTVEAANAFPCLVVVPNLVKINWLREIDLWLPGRSITILDSSGVVKPVKFRKHAKAGGGSRVIHSNDLTAEFMVVNYDILVKVLPRFSGMKLGAVIYDEAHYLKNPKAKRTDAAKKLAGNAKMRIMATGTAILNRPIELASPLEILGRLGEFGGKSAFAKRYCGAHYDSLGHWDTSGATNLGELNERLREVCYVRRDKRDVLTELPEVQRQTVELPISNRAEYRRAEADVVGWVRENASLDEKFKLTLEGLDEEDRKAAIRQHTAEKVKRAESAEALRRMGALRQLTGKGKLAAVKEWTAEFLEQEGKLILFAWHVEVQNELVAAFPGCARVIASDSKEKRDEEVRRFQEDPSCELIVIGLNVGGVGITITAAHHCAFVELPWRPGDVDQAEGRAYGRLNDAHGLSSYYLVGEDTFDLDMAELIDAKRSVTDAVNSGKEGVSGASIMSSLIERMEARARGEAA